MARGIFVTGGSGYVGARLLSMLASSGRPIVALERGGSVVRPSMGDHAFRIVKGDLLDGDAYRSALADCGVVVHLAAATGNAPAAVHERVNVEGTAELIRRSREAGVERFIFVSSVAATFDDIARYPYAQSKRRAEQIVAECGFPFTIIRPTIVAGPKAPVLASLEKLAGLPVAVLPGDGRCVVQPVHVDDLARLLAQLATACYSEADLVVDVGGPARVTMEEFVRRIRQARTGRRGPLLKVPLWALQIPLRCAAALGVAHLMPVTEGQLASFREDGVSRTGVLPHGWRPEHGVDRMLSDADSPHAAGPLARECDVFTRYLLGIPASPYVVRKYAGAHIHLDGLRPTAGFDTWLVRHASTSTWRAGLCDAYAALMTPRAALRQKLITLLAILEASHPSSTLIDAPLAAGRSKAVIALIGHGLRAFAMLAVALVALGPVHALMRTRNRG